MRESWEITERSGDVGSGKTECEFTCTLTEEEGVRASLLAVI